MQYMFVSSSGTEEASNVKKAARTKNHGNRPLWRARHQACHDKARRSVDRTTSAGRKTSGLRSDRTPRHKPDGASPKHVTVTRTLSEKSGSGRFSSVSQKMKPKPVNAVKTRKVNAGRRKPK